MLDQNAMKQKAGEYALKFIKPGMLVGVGTGSTVKYFIEALASMKNDIEGCVSSSIQSTELLKKLNIPVFELNSTGPLDIYIDGADEANSHLNLIKGGGAALTREKVLASASKQFVCIIDQSKLVDVLGTFPLPVEVIPMARSYVGRELVKLGGQPVWREGVVTDNGNWIIDLHNLSILNPLEMEQKINQIAGVVTNGIFASCGADILVIANQTGEIKELRRI